MTRGGAVSGGVVVGVGAVVATRDGSSLLMAMPATASATTIAAAANATSPRPERARRGDSDTGTEVSGDHLAAALPCSHRIEIFSSVRRRINWLVASRVGLLVQAHHLVVGEHQLPPLGGSALATWRTSSRRYSRARFRLARWSRCFTAFGVISSTAATSPGESCSHATSRSTSASVPSRRAAASRTSRCSNQSINDSSAAPAGRRTTTPDEHGVVADARYYATGDRPRGTRPRKARPAPHPPPEQNQGDATR